MRCEEFVELVTDHLDGVLGRDAQRRVREHSAGCAGCRRYLDQVLTIIGMLREPMTAPPA
jgi:predicted anti-sigma-YlaC factor YlaD